MLILMMPDFLAVIWRYCYQQTIPYPFHQHAASLFIQLKFESAST